MRNLKFILLFFISIIEGLTSIFLLSNYYILTGILLHLAFFLIFNFLVKRTVEEELVLPTFLILFLPGAGALIVVFLIFSVGYFKGDNETLLDYQKTINFEAFFKALQKINYDKEIRTLSFHDLMNLLDVESKKKLIIQFNDMVVPNQVKLLKKGLLDHDPEVKHYSATLINKLEKEYTLKINKLQKDFLANMNIETAKELNLVYRDYIESGLINGGVLLEFNRKYIEILEWIQQNKSNNPEILRELVRANIRNQDILKAEAINNKFLENHPDNEIVYENKLRIAYEKNKFDEIKEIISNISDRNIKGKYSFWIGE